MASSAAREPLGATAGSPGTRHRIHTEPGAPSASRSPDQGELRGPLASQAAQARARTSPERDEARAAPPPPPWQHSARYR